MRFNNLNDWLTWQEGLSPVEIDLGLDRVSAVLSQAGLSSNFECPLVTVAGTNGKGSVVAMLEAMAMAAGLKVCSYTSPHLFLYNERIKLNSQAVDDGVLCDAFNRIDQSRGEIQLTYFEFGTLAAIDIFFRESPDLVILEVGLGGRLDAVNVMDADVSVITSISIDHIDWLGDDRELIGYEKAGVLRFEKPVVCGDYKPPTSVVDQAEKLKCDFLQIGRDFAVKRNNTSDALWALQSCFGGVDEIPEPSLQGEFQKSNAAVAITALQVLQAECLLSSGKQKGNAGEFDRTMVAGLMQINLSGRFQQVNSRPQVFVDVAHNPHAACELSNQIKALSNNGEFKTWAIVAMLADKDVAGVLQNVSAEIDNWCFAGLTDINRGLSAEKLDKLARENGINQCTIQAETVAKTCELVMLKVDKGDRVIIFGSFYTVAEAMQFFSKLKKS